MSRKRKKKFNNFKRTLKDFIKDEDGFVSRKTILKIGLGTISALGILGSLSNVIAGHTNHASHTNDLIQDSVPGTQCWKIDHSSHPSHNSHNSY